MGLIAWICGLVVGALHKCAESVRREEGGNLQPEIQPSQPVEVRAVVSFSDKTEGDTKAENDRAHATQVSIRNATRGAVVAASVYALITLLMWCQMIKQNRIARAALRQSTESFRIDERAWVELQPITPSATFRYQLYPKNIGKTAATNITINALRGGQLGSITMGESAYQISMLQDKMIPGSALSDVPRVNPVSKVLAPNTVATVPFIMDGQAPQIFPKDEWVAYLIGRIDYNDAFKVHHWLKFCFFVVNAKGDLWNCREGNDEDNNPELPSD
jgi:hypothetical protein